MLHRALAAALAFALMAGLALYVAPLVLSYLDGPSVEAAMVEANEQACGRFTFAFESERVDSQGNTVYRFVSDTEPEIVQVLRYKFYWLPCYTGLSETDASPQFKGPGPVYELFNLVEYSDACRSWAKTHELA